MVSCAGVHLAVLAARHLPRPAHVPPLHQHQVTVHCSVKRLNYVTNIMYHYSEQNKMMAVDCSAHFHMKV